MDKVIRLLLVDDHPVVRSGLQMLLENEADLDIVGQTDSGLDALGMIPYCHPDVVVMDITLPDISGIEATRRIKSHFPSVVVLALTIHEDPAYFFQMLNAGASGYVPKRAAPQDLIAAIHAAFAGEIYLYPLLAKSLINDYLNRAANEPDLRPIEELTPREQEVLELLAQGVGNEEIAERLVISKHTVARHREHLMSKLQLHSRSDLVKYAIRKGLIEI